MLIQQENYLNAKIGSLSFDLSETNGNFSATRFEQSDGSTLLSINISDSNQEGFAIEIPFYNGARKYLIGKENILAGSISFNKTNPNRNWICKYPGADGINNFIEIVKDDGVFIEGIFNFSGRNSADLSLMQVTDGKFGIVSIR